MPYGLKPGDGKPFEPLWKVCPRCHVAIMRDHPEQPHRWRKCTLCGYTEEQPKRPPPPWKKEQG
jgi:ribosomal protein S27AE